MEIKGVKMNISSIIVKTQPKYYNEVWGNLKKSGLCDMHFGEKNKGIIIITIEGECVEEEINKIRCIKKMPFIISANMHMSYCAEEIEKMKENIDFKKTVKELNKEKPLEKIQYFGSLKGKY